VVIPVAAGRNIAVLLEAAVRNTILQLRGINTLEDFMERQQGDGSRRLSMEILLISGISGAGKSVALRVLEDANYYCVLIICRQGCCHNWWKPWSRIISYLLLLRLIPAASADCILPQTIQMLKKEGHHVRVLFLTASTESLVARFSETRRSHPLSRRLNLDMNQTPTRTLTEVSG
jgi:UPF0042 nucleotide-binding protein